jgi:hypothetical protein
VIKKMVGASFSGVVANDHRPAANSVSGIRRTPAIRPPSALMRYDHRLPYIFFGYNARAAASVSAGCSHLSRGLSGPALEGMRECTHLTKTEEPGNFGDMQLAIIEVANR